MKIDRNYVGIPGFRIERLIGNGSFSQVYLGFDVNKSTSCVIKLLNTRESAETEQKYLAKRQDIMHEILVGKMLEHELIVAPYAGGKNRDSFYAVLPYLEPDNIDKRNLAKMYPAGTILEPKQVEEIVINISAALQHCHDRGVIHCDIKPNNFLVGKDKRVKLSDFGISLVQGVDSRISFGPTHFAAPEQIQGKTCYQSDQYSLACVAYLYLTGKYPFHDENKDEIRRMHLESDIPAMEITNKEIELVIHRAMSKSPKNRFSNITEFSQELTRSIH